MSGLALRAFAPGDAAALRAIYNRCVAPNPGWTAAEAPGLWTQVAQGDRTRVAVRDGRVVGAVGTVLAPPWMYIWPLVTDDDEAARALLEAALASRTADVARSRVGVRAGEEAKRRALVARGFEVSIQFHELVHDLGAAPDVAAPPGLRLHTGGAIEREPLRELHDLTFAEIDNTAPLDPADLAAMLDGPTAWPEATAVWAAPGGALAGFVIGLRGEDDRGRFGILEAIGVAPAARGQGLARAMAEWLLAQARLAGMAEVRSVVAGSNAASLALHRAIGFGERERKQMYDLTAV
jgi:ribosomal protein S18 acetylase RimI-like enzyme